MAYLLLPIMGTGTIDDPFRPNFPLIVSSIPGFQWSAHIPSNPDGTPPVGSEPQGGAIQG